VTTTPLGTDTDMFVEALRAQSQRYHSAHPFHVRMNEGELSPQQIRGWVANRYHYQESIPRKDAAILANCPDVTVRRRWLRRIVDHDGTAPDTERSGAGPSKDTERSGAGPSKDTERSGAGPSKDTERSGAGPPSGGSEGGIEAWLRLGEACGLTREEIADHRHLAPGVRFAVDAYVTFARTRPWVEAVASSLTELFAPDLMGERLAAFEKYYTWIDPEGLAYFRNRLFQAPRDSEHALEVVTEHCRTPEQQASAVQALSFKNDVLWSMMDAIERAYPS